MLKRECVLVVDEISDTADVLQAVLEPRGVAVNRVRRLGELAVPGAAGRPTVMVLDAESLAGIAAPAGNGWQNIPQVILGTIRVIEQGAADNLAPTPARRYLQKPFQFAELVQAIESLIAPAPM